VKEIVVEQGAGDEEKRMIENMRGIAVDDAEFVIMAEEKKDTVNKKLWLENMTRITEDDLQFVSGTAWRFYKQNSILLGMLGIDFCSLEDAAFGGMEDACKRYDETRGKSLRGFYYIRVVGSMWDFIRSRSLISRSALKAIKEVQSYVASQSQDGRVVTSSEIYEIFSEAHVMAMAQSNNRVAFPLSLDQIVLYGGQGGRVQAETSYHNLISDDSDTEDDATYQQALEELRDVIKEVSLNYGSSPEVKERALSLMEKRYNFDSDSKAPSFRELGDEFGCTESRVSQIHSKLISKLKDEEPALDILRDLASRISRQGISSRQSVRIVSFGQPDLTPPPHIRQKRRISKREDVYDKNVASEETLLEAEDIEVEGVSDDSSTPQDTKAVFLFDSDIRAYKIMLDLLKKSKDGLVRLKEKHKVTDEVLLKLRRKGFAIMQSDGSVLVQKKKYIRMPDPESESRQDKAVFSSRKARIKDSEPGKRGARKLTDSDWEERHKETLAKLYERFPDGCVVGGLGTIFIELNMRGGFNYLKRFKEDSGFLEETSRLRHSFSEKAEAYLESIGKILIKTEPEDVPEESKNITATSGKPGRQKLSSDHWSARHKETLKKLYDQFPDGWVIGGLSTVFKDLGIVGGQSYLQRFRDVSGFLLKVNGWKHCFSDEAIAYLESIGLTIIEPEEDDSLETDDISTSGSRRGGRRKLTDADWDVRLRVTVEKLHERFPDGWIVGSLTEIFRDLGIKGGYNYLHRFRESFYIRKVKHRQHRLTDIASRYLESIGKNIIESDPGKYDQERFLRSSQKAVEILTPMVKTMKQDDWLAEFLSNVVQENGGFCYKTDLETTCKDKYGFVKKVMLKTARNDGYVSEESGGSGEITEKGQEFLRQKGYIN